MSEVQLGKVETRVDNLEKKVDKLENNNELLYKLTLISESQSKQLARMEDTFNNININLTNLNNSQEALKNSIENIDNRVDKIEVAVEENRERDNISISEHLKKWITWLLYGLPTLILGAYVLFKSGL